MNPKEFERIAEAAERAREAWHAAELKMIRTQRAAEVAAKAQRKAYEAWTQASDALAAAYYKTPSPAAKGAS